MNTEQAMAELQAERDCARLIRRFAQLSDCDDGEAFVDLFVPDGRWCRLNNDEVVGHDAIREVYGRRSTSERSRHEMMGIDVRVSSATQAEATSTVFVLKPWSEARSVAHVGAYTDVMRLCEDGRWRFVYRKTELLISSDHGAKEA